MLQLRVLLYELFDLLFEDLHFLPHCIHQVTLYQILKCRRACALGKHRSGPGVPRRTGGRARCGECRCVAAAGQRRAGPGPCHTGPGPGCHRRHSRAARAARQAPPPRRPRPPARRLQPVLGAGCRISLPPAVRARPRVTSERGAANGRPSYL